MRLLTYVVATFSADSSTNTTPPEFANPTSSCAIASWASLSGLARKFTQVCGVRIHVHLREKQARVRRRRGRLHLVRCDSTARFDGAAASASKRQRAYAPSASCRASPRRPTQKRAGLDCAVRSILQAL